MVVRAESWDLGPFGWCAVTLRSVARRTFASLLNANYRKYFIGQTVSLVGTWMQATAQSWLVLVLTHSATDIGVVVALQSLPMLLLAPYGGVIADRVDKRRFQIILQLIMGAQAGVLALLTLTHTVTYVEVCVLAIVLGLNNAFEYPARQAFMLEMVGPHDLRNAISLNSAMINAARTLGPAVAGVLIATVGEGWCFVVNALSFFAVVGSLVTMDVSRLAATAPATRAKGQLREGVRYVARTPQLGVPLVMMLLVGIFAYEFQVTLPVVASGVFRGGAEVYGALTASMGLGAVIGGLTTATRGRTGLTPITTAVAAFGVFLIVAAVAPVLGIEYLALAAVGFASVLFQSVGNATMQLIAQPQMRGRVMALWSVAFFGSTPIGGPLIGWITNEAGARAGLAVGAASCLVAAAIAVGYLYRQRTHHSVANAG